MSGTLSASNSQLVSRVELLNIAPPPATDTWKPIAHADLIHALDRQLLVRDIRISREQFAIQHGGARLFGVLDLTYAATDEFAAALALRNSTDKSMALEIAVGLRVFCCDNMALSGDLIAMRRKHTSGFNLNADLSMAIDKYQEQLSTLRGQVEALRSRGITDDAAKVLIFNAFQQEILPIRFFPTVTQTYFTPGETMTDVLTRTYWGLHNAFTRAIKQMAPGPAFAATVQLGRLFGLTNQPA